MKIKAFGTVNSNFNINLNLFLRNYRKISLIQSENVEVYSHEVLDNPLGPSNNQSSGIYKMRKDKIKIYVDENTDQTTMPTVTISPLVLENCQDIEMKIIELKKGYNIIENNCEGIIHFQNESEKTLKNGIEVYIKGGEKIPCFILGKTYEKIWMLKRSFLKNNLGVELIGKNSIVTISKHNITHLNSPKKLLNNLEKVIEYHNITSGINNFSTLHRKPRGLIQHLRECKNEYFMYAWYLHTGYHTLDGMKEMLQEEGLGWGNIHEIAHTFQMKRMEWTDLDEVTVNIYSLRAKKELGFTSRLEEDQIYDKGFKLLAHNIPFDNIPDEFTKLVMFWQLELSFGKTFYPDLHKLYREEAKELTSDTEKKIYFMLSCSKIANRNLAPFFHKWGFYLSEDLLQKLSNYPKLEQEIWKNRDSQQISVSNTQN
ncbi:M60 family metallopeptidase [Enterococcus plantarum]|uniref:M60 family metallopeptidase n=1 Tax=Enterococcus plantarum TaxID=1077675 RepID=UPI001A90B5E5|nr:M60 family metallopeptidase [Enterococcus plantarum]MBO0422194.1 M60 family metallopeptidase [Enterococcus plantarum]